MRGLAACCKWVEQQCAVMWIDNLITTVLDRAGFPGKKGPFSYLSLLFFLFSFTFRHNTNLMAWQTSSKHNWSHFSCGLTRWYAWWWMIIHNEFYCVRFILCSVSLYCHVLINFCWTHNSGVKSHFWKMWLLLKMNTFQHQPLSAWNVLNLSLIHVLLKGCSSIKEAQRPKHPCINKLKCLLLNSNSALSQSAFYINTLVTRNKWNVKHLHTHR